MRLKANSRILAIAILAVSCVAALVATAGAADSGVKAPGLDGSLPSLGAGEPPSQTVIPGHYIVVFKDAVGDPGAVAEKQTDEHDGDLGFVYRSGLKGYSAELSKDAVEALRANPKVQYVTPDHKVEAAAQTIPRGIQRTFATSNSKIDIDGIDDIRVNADVAVIDTGVDYTHPDLNVYKRTDCVPADGNESTEKCVDSSGTDNNGHGSHVAGTIGAIDNGEGVVGVAPGARIWGVRVLNGGGFGSESWIIAGVNWVTAHSSEVEVANMSLGCTCKQPALNAAIDASIEAGVVYVVAAGNSSEPAENFSPADDPNAITVSALADYDGKTGGTSSTVCEEFDYKEFAGLDDELAAFSNYGPAVDVAAPGVCILSTSNFGNYKVLSGTSMASPHVAGAAAVMASESNPNSKKDVEAIRQRIVDEGSYNWRDTAPDIDAEPAVYLGPALPTEADTGGVSNLEPASATLNGLVNPRDVETSYHFDYGPTSGYGQTVPVPGKSIGGGKQGVNVSQSITTKPGVTYHYRLVATNSQGTFYGQDRSFTRWQDLTPNKPSGSVKSELRGVSCTSASFCVAVGNKTDSEGHLATLIEVWNGSGWTVKTSPNPALNNTLDDVSCVSSTWCLAVGYAQPLPGAHHPGLNGTTALTAVWNGTAWSEVATPRPTEAPGSDELSSVSCVSSTWCEAGGSYWHAGDGNRSLVENWNGTKWSVQSAPTWKTVDYPATFDGISCVSEAFCFTVGEAMSVFSIGFSMAEVDSWNGSKWSWAWSAGEEEEFNGNLNRGLKDVSCTSTTACTAVGVERPASAYNQDGTRWFAKWNGTTWTQVRSHRRSRPEGVSCVGVNACASVGSIPVGATSTNMAAIDYWDGSAWEVQSPAVSGELAPSSLHDVSCIQARECVAVGSFSESGNPRATANRLNILPPAASTAPAFAVGGENATLNGTVNPDGLETTYQFEYGPTTAYGTKVPASPEGVGSGSTVVGVSEAIGGLVPGNTYHFRVSATSVGGTVYGADQQFKTPVLTSLCKTSETICPSAQSYPKGTTLEAKLKPETKLNLEGTLAGSCTGSTMSAKMATEVGTPLPLEVTAMTFSGCKPCSTMEARNLPYASGVERAEPGNGNMPVKDGGKGKPTLKLTGCPLGVSCVFGASELPLTMKGGNPATLSTEKLSMTYEEGSKTLCGSAVTLNAGYEINSPKPVFVESTRGSVLCKENSASCPAGATYAASTSVEAKLKPETKLNLEGSVAGECTGSTLSAKTTGEKGLPLPLEVTAMTFSGCKPCSTMEARNLPYAGGIERSEAANGTMRVKEGGKGRPAVKLTGCPLGVSCVFGASELPLTMKGGNPATLSAEKPTMTFEEGSSAFCGPTLKLNGSYEINSPKPVFVESIP